MNRSAQRWGALPPPTNIARAPCGARARVAQARIIAFASAVAPKNLVLFGARSCVVSNQGVAPLTPHHAVLFVGKRQSLCFPSVVRSAPSACPSHPPSICTRKNCYKPTSSRLGFVGRQRAADAPPISAAAVPAASPLSLRRLAPLPPPSPPRSAPRCAAATPPLPRGRRSARGAPRRPSLRSQSGLRPW